MLSHPLASRIAEVVAKDPRCQARIGNHARLPQLTEWGVAGAMRNTAMLLLWREAGTPEFDQFSCVGVTEATTEASSAAGSTAAARTGRPVELPEVRHATGIYRILDGTHHQACWVVMANGCDDVFDWHKSLELRDPYPYRTADWRADLHGVLLTRFNGFDL